MICSRILQHSRLWAGCRRVDYVLSEVENRIERAIDSYMELSSSPFKKDNGIFGLTTGDYDRLGSGTQPLKRSDSGLWTSILGLIPRHDLVSPPIASAELCHRQDMPSKFFRVLSSAQYHELASLFQFLILWFQFTLLMVQPWLLCHLIVLMIYSVPGMH
jgi:hypothetical protein